MWQASGLPMASLKGKSLAIDISLCRKLISPPTLTGYEALTNIPLNPTFFRSPLICPCPHWQHPTDDKPPVISRYEAQSKPTWSLGDTECNRFATIASSQMLSYVMKLNTPVS